ncbi:uncharacterized protein LOC144564307 [Carex rostrata]
MKDRILTHKVMVKRCFNCDPECVMCPTNLMETTFHLFFQCSYVRQVWQCMGQLVQLDVSAERLWEVSWSQYKMSIGGSKRVWLTRIMAVLWGVWKQRNSRIFGRPWKPAWLLARDIKEETEMWLKCCRSSVGIG